MHVQLNSPAVHNLAIYDVRFQQERAHESCMLGCTLLQSTWYFLKVSLPQVLKSAFRIIQLIHVRFVWCRNHSNINLHLLIVSKQSFVIQ